MFFPGRKKKVALASSCGVRRGSNRVLDFQKKRKRLDIPGERKKIGGGKRRECLSRRRRTTEKEKVRCDAGIGGKEKKRDGFFCST